MAVQIETPADANLRALPNVNLPESSLQHRLVTRREMLVDCGAEIFGDLPLEIVAVLYAKRAAEVEQQEQVVKGLKQGTPEHQWAEFLLFGLDDERSMAAGALYRQGGGAQ